MDDNSAREISVLQHGSRGAQDLCSAIGVIWLSASG